MFDSHIHSTFSPDSKITLEQGCEVAIQKNLQGVAFTDHFELDITHLLNEMGADVNFIFDIAERSKVLDQIKEKFSKNLKVLKGLEIGFQPHITSELSKIIKDSDFDFIIGSVHVVDKIDASMDKYFSDKTQHQAYQRYLEEIYSCVCNFKDYDVVGHIGYVRRYGNFTDRSMKHANYADILDAILKKVIQSGKGIEINSSGYRGILGTPMPDYDIVTRYKELGGEIITLGSDSHVPETIAHSFDVIKEKIKNLGFKYICYFEKREPRFVKIK